MKDREEGTLHSAGTTGTMYSRPPVYPRWASVNLGSYLVHGGSYHLHNALFCRNRNLGFPFSLSLFLFTTHFTTKVGHDSRCTITLLALSQITLEMHEHIVTCSGV